MRTIHPSDWIAQPWKNGGGVTHEVARGGGEPWTHRLSVAEVASGGPFSRFEGVDRHLMLLAGAGFRLRSAAGWTRTLERPHCDICFAGEEAIDCELMGGPCRDFNVMVRRAAARARLEVVALGGAPVALRTGALAHYLLVLDGAARARGPAGEALLGPLAAAALDQGPGEVTIEPVDGPATLASVAIDAVREPPSPEVTGPRSRPPQGT